MDLTLKCFDAVCGCFSLETELCDLEFINSVNLQYTHGLEFQNEGRLEDAIQSYRECISNNNKHIGAYFNLGICFYQQSQIVDALFQFEKVISMDPNHCLAHFNLGHLFYFHRHDVHSARKYLEIASNLNPNDSDTWIMLGLIFRDLNDFERSILATQQAIKNDPRNAMALYNLGNTYHDFGKYDEAIFYYSEAIQLDSQNADALFNLGVVYQAKLEMIKALDCYVQATKHDPNLEEAKEAAKMVLQYLSSSKKLGQTKEQSSEEHVHSLQCGCLAASH